MRIVQVSTSDLRGGAARAAYRLMRGLRAAGEDCSMLVRDKTSTDPHVHAVALENSRTARRLQDELYHVRRECIDYNRTALSNSWFSLPAPGYDISAHESVRAAEVIHLHWVSEFLSPVAIAQLQAAGRPVVWTIHDQRPFTGGCHYSAGCAGFERDCAACPQLASDTVALTEAALAESIQCLRPGIVVVSPSRWMADCARRSASFSKARIEVIPNGVDTQVFKPGRAEARQALGLDQSCVYFLAGAEAGNEKRKGFHLLRDAVERCLREKQFAQALSRRAVEFLFFGPPIADPGFPARQLGRIDSEPELAKCYAAADAFLLPSLEDNLPNTMLEALCCGTPVVGFRIGGLPDAVESGNNGLLAEPGDTGHFARFLQDIEASPALRQKLSQHCLQDRARFDVAEQARRHLALYHELSRPTEAIAWQFDAKAECPLAPFGQAFAATYRALLGESRRRRARRRWRSFIRKFATH